MVATVALGGTPDELHLAKLECRGDQSRLCCNAPALGQQVVAVGMLTRGDNVPRWTLLEPALCQLAAER